MGKMLIILLKINDDVPSDEVSYILHQLSHDIDITGFPPSYCGKERSGVRVFNSNGEPVGTLAFKEESQKEGYYVSTAKAKPC
jgi:hypothetical protein